MEHNRDILEMVDLIFCNNTPEQIKEAEREADGDEIQEQSFALLKQFVAEHRT